MRDDFFNKQSDKNTEKILFILALMFLAFTLFRLWGIKPKNNSMAPAIVFTQWWDREPEIEVLKTLIEEFESLHSGIKITLASKPYEDLRRDLFESAGNEFPGKAFPGNEFPGDIIALDPLWVSGLLEKEIIDSANMPPISFINVFYYNTGILRENGFFRKPKSRGEFLNYARVITPCLALGMNSSRGIYDDIFPWIWSAGTQLITDGKPTVNTRPVIESLSFLAGLNSEGLILPGAFSADSGKKLEDFVSGRAAFMIAPANEIRFVRERLGDDFGVTSIPAPDNYPGKSFFASAGWTVGVYSGSAHKKEAGLFADFLAEKASLLSDISDGVLSGNMQEPDDLSLKVWDIAIAGELAQDFSDLPWPELEETFREELAILFAGKSTPAEAAAAIQKRWEGILE